MLRRLFRHRTTIITYTCLGLCLCLVIQLDPIQLYERNSKKSQIQAIVSNTVMKKKSLYTPFIGKESFSARKTFSKKSQRTIQPPLDKAETKGFVNKRKTEHGQGDAFTDLLSSDEHLQRTRKKYFLRIIRRKDSNQADVIKGQNDDYSHRFRSINVDDRGGFLELRDNSRTNIISQITSKESVSRLQDISLGNLTSSKTPCFIKGIYWTSSMKELLPEGMQPVEADKWLQIIRQNKVKFLRPPKWNQCGRPKNGIARIDGGPTVCARYRYPHNRLVFGEVISYWLSRYLGLKNVPPVALSLINSSQWSNVRSQVRDLGWQKDQYTALIMWISQIGSNQRSEAYMPHPILKAIKTGHPWTPMGPRDQDGCYQIESESDVTIRPHGQSVMKDDDNSVSYLIQLAQWSNMIVFDYITGNYDRVASMLDGAENENRSEILNDPMRNLPVSRQTGELWLIDNESGLFDAYDLLFLGMKNGERFHRFHRTLLHTMCVFDKTVIDRVRSLYKKSRPHLFLEALIIRKERLVRGFPTDSSHLLFEKHFPDRLRNVLDWVDHCQQLFDGVM